MTVTPFAWKDKPSLIESVLPVQKISAETQKERKSGSGQTLTCLGSYWKGRKMLILNKACILGALLPATDDPEEDLGVFELLMAIDDESFKRRLKLPRDADKLDKNSYVEKLAITNRPEECVERELYAPIWQRVNQHLGTSSKSLPELVEQLGILRFGRRPKVADTFCGSGQIPFEAARLGCEVYASDLNPIACMLTWGALNIVGADKVKHDEIKKVQRAVVEAVDQEMTALSIEHDESGNRSKAYLYCLETRCPQTGWMVPMSPSWIISKTRNVVAKLVPDPKMKRFDIDIVSDATADEMASAEKGTVQSGNLVYELNGEEHSTPIKTIRGDYRSTDGTRTNRLRRWEKHDFMPRPDDIYQERLYAVQWITKDSLGKGRQKTFFAGVTAEDLACERKIEEIVGQNLSNWQEQGLVPDMLIQPGYNTDQPIRERGWTHWHHLYNARQLLMLSRYRQQAYVSPVVLIGLSKMADYGSKLCRWDAGHEGSSPQVVGTYTNQALNTVFNYGTKASMHAGSIFEGSVSSSSPVKGGFRVSTSPANSISERADIFITDPPYADAVHYHEITEFFIAWLRKNPSKEFADWIWDSRRPLAIKGDGEDFRREMIAAYKAMTEHMPDNGLQIVMFTHQDASVWADMASIVWGAGLQVSAAWYIATETTSELKKGGYVQGTVLLVLRKRLNDEAVYRDELVEEVKCEVAQQIETMTGLNQTTRGKGRSENLFEDADLQMAGYAAALRVLTGYRRIDGTDMAAEALRPRNKGDRDIVREIIDYAVQVANEHLVPEGLPPGTWERSTGAERFYLKMLDIEASGLKKLDNYQNFAKAFRVGNYADLMGSMKANDARLKTAKDFKKSGFDGDYGKSPLRAVLFAVYELQRELDSDEVMAHLRDLVPGYHSRREDLIALCQFLAAKREQFVPEEAASARVLLTRIKNERLGG